MSNNTPDYENNLAFEPAKIAGTMATMQRDGKAVTIRCYIDGRHYTAVIILTLVWKTRREKWTGLTQKFGVKSAIADCR